MNFNTLVKNQLFPIFEKYGFEIEEELTNILRFRSSVVGIDIAYNSNEQSCMIWIGAANETLWEFGDNDVDRYFNSSLSIERVAPEVFIDNLSMLFHTKAGVKILNGDIVRLRQYKLMELECYNDELRKIHH